MHLVFELSMPGVGSWNGKWTGAGNYYAVVRSLGRSKKAEDLGREIAEKGSYHYVFGDGWCARINVKVVTAGEAAKARRASKGFWGYEWMVDSIIKNGKIDPGPPSTEAT